MHVSVLICSNVVCTCIEVSVLHAAICSSSAAGPVVFLAGSRQSSFSFGQGGRGGGDDVGGGWGSCAEGDGDDGGNSGGEGEVEDLMHARDDLMDSILEDEEEIIALHRQQIEESMEIVRRWGTASIVCSCKDAMII